MKNLSTKTLFISLLLSAVISLGVQVGDVNKSEKLIREVRVTESQAHKEHATEDSAANKEAAIKTVKKIIVSVGIAVATVEEAIKVAETEGYKKDFTELIVPLYILVSSAGKEVLEVYREAAEEGGEIKREVAHKKGVEALGLAQGIVALAVKIRKEAKAEAGLETYKKALKLAQKTAEEADEALTAEAEKLYKKTQ